MKLNNLNSDVSYFQNFVFEDFYGPWVAFEEQTYDRDVKLGIYRGYSLEEYVTTECTIYIYHYGFNYISEYDFKLHLTSCVDAIKHYKGGKIIQLDNTEIVSPVALKFSGFIFDLDPETESSLYLASFRNHFIKVRITYDNLIDTEEMIDYKNLLLENLGQQLESLE